MTDEKRKKPFADYPLRWHPQGYWIKKIRGKVHYFGERWGDWRTALDDYERVAADLHAGREPAPKGLTVKDLCELFLRHKQTALDAGEFAPRSMRDYIRVGQMLCDLAGGSTVESMRPADFGCLRKELAKGRSVVSSANLIRVARMIFRFAETEELIEGRIRFGTQFSEPSARAKKKHRASQQRQSGLKMFEPWEIRRLLYSMGPVWRAMVLCGINCGWGNSDISQLRIHQVKSVVDYPRPKTGESRRNVLWPETVAALLTAIEVRPAPISDALKNRVFLTKGGREWVRGDTTYVNDEIAKQFSKKLKTVGLKRPGLGFYALRHTLVTIGEEIADKPALDRILGHADSTVRATYRERIEDFRLSSITEHVLRWLCAADPSDTVAEMSQFEKN